MNKFYLILAGCGLMGFACGAGASGIPIHSGSEATTQAVDGGRSGVLDDMVKLQDKMVDSMQNAIGGRETFGLNSLKTNLQGVLTTSSETVGSARAGLGNLVGKTSGAISSAVGGVTQTVEGKVSEYKGVALDAAGSVKDVVGSVKQTGEGKIAEYKDIVVKASGEHIGPMKEKIKDMMAEPVGWSEKARLTTAEHIQKGIERAKALEDSASSALAKAWIVQSESANTSASVGTTAEELSNAESQQSIIGTILRLQEETQKNLNTRMTIMAEELKMDSLLALDGGANRGGGQ